MLGDDSASVIWLQREGLPVCHVAYSTRGAAKVLSRTYFYNFFLNPQTSLHSPLECMGELLMNSRALLGSGSCVVTVYST